MADTDYRGSNLDHTNDPAAERMYWIGRFVQRFANTERVIHFSLRAIVGLPDAAGRALFNTLSTADAVTALIRLQEATTGLHAELTPTLTHFRNITEFRHRTVHRPIGPTEKGLTSDTIMTALSPDKAQIMNFTLDDLKAATFDLDRIMLRMLIMSFPKLESLLPKEDAFGTWLYKPVQLDNQNRQRQSDHPG